MTDSKLPFDELRNVNLAKFRDFKKAKEEIFSVCCDGALEIDVCCDIAILERTDGKVSVEIEAGHDDLLNFSVQRNDDTITLRQNGSSGATITTVVSGGSVSIINGRIIIDGKEIDVGKNSISKNPSNKAPRVIIKAPPACAIDAKMRGNSSLYSTIPHEQARIAVSGQSYADVAARCLVLKVSGQSKAKAYMGGGYLDARVSGQGTARVDGSYSVVKAELSGQAVLETEGTVHEEYHADASGMAQIKHRGTVKGRVYRDKSGLAQIDIR